MIYKTNRSQSYIFTIDLTNESDLAALSDLKAKINKERNAIKRNNAKYPQYPRPYCFVEVRYRKPLKPHPHSKKNHKYGRGGSVRVSQMPQSADVYLRVSI